MTSPSSDETSLPDTGISIVSIIVNWAEGTVVLDPAGLDPHALWGLLLAAADRAEDDLPSIRMLGDTSDDDEDDDDGKE